MENYSCKDYAFDGILQVSSSCFLEEQQSDDDDSNKPNQSRIEYCSFPDKHLAYGGMLGLDQF